MLGMCSVTFKEKTVEEVISITKKANLSVIEWSERDHVPSNDLSFAQKVGQLTHEAGLQTSSYGSYYVVGSHQNFQQQIDTAKALQTDMIRVWAGDKGSAEISVDDRLNVYGDAKRIAILARNAGMSISFEYHSNTLTDTPESAERLMQSINESNVYLYWQPNEQLSPDERVSSLENLGQYVTNIHVFHWDDPFNRYPLSEGSDEWSRYIKQLKNTLNNQITHHYLLEFVKNDDDNQFIEDAQTLHKLLSEI